MSIFVAILPGILAELIVILRAVSPNTIATMKPILTEVRDQLNAVLAVIG